MIILLNAHAGHAWDSQQLQSRVFDQFAAAGVHPEIEILGSSEITASAKRAIGRRDGTIVAGGGDGTISAVASELAGTGKSLGVLPLGTLNHFARDLQIPTSLEAAVRTILDGRITMVDIAEVNGRIFINNSGLGIYPHIVQRRQTEQKRSQAGKWPALGWALVNAFRRFPFLDLRIEVEGKTLRRRTAFLFVGNNEYEMTGFQIGARNRLNAGKLALYLTHRVGRWGLIRLGLRAVFGRLSQEKDFETFLVEEASIEARRHSILLATDGEVQRLRTPLYYRCRAGGLRVIVPRNSSH